MIKDIIIGSLVLQLLEALQMSFQIQTVDLTSRVG